jgi:hypothetical protein
MKGGLNPALDRCNDASHRARFSLSQRSRKVDSAFQGHCRPSVERKPLHGRTTLLLCHLGCRPISFSVEFRGSDVAWDPDRNELHLLQGRHTLHQEWI